jgi:cell shape-determining protein MreC
MSDYKKIWEQSLSERNQELESLKAENARLREALGYYADDESGTDNCEVARRALKGGE